MSGGGGGGGGMTEMFGPYMVFEKLGSGGMATVQRAKKQGIAGFEREVALKRMLPHLSEDPDFVESFIREAKVASLMVHPNIAQVHDFGRIDGTYFIAMEHVDGPDVRKLLRFARRSGQSIPLPVALSLLGETCEALHYAHTFADEEGTPLDIVHRDISPSNLIVAHTGHCKVIDFGIAKASSANLHTDGGHVKGKYAYMAPEAARGQILGALSDVFSLGVVAHEMLTLRPLFSASTDLETIMRIREAPIPPPSSVVPSLPPGLDDVILAALSRDPTQRLQSAGAFRSLLDEVARYANIHATARDVTEWLATIPPEDGGRVSGRASMRGSAAARASRAPGQTPGPAGPGSGPHQGPSEPGERYAYSPTPSRDRLPLPAPPLTTMEPSGQRESRRPLASTFPVEPTREVGHGTVDERPSGAHGGGRRNAPVMPLLDFTVSMPPGTPSGSTHGPQQGRPSHAPVPASGPFAAHGSQHPSGMHPSQQGQAPYQAAHQSGPHAFDQHTPHGRTFQPLPTPGHEHVQPTQPTRKSKVGLLLLLPVALLAGGVVVFAAMRQGKSDGAGKPTTGGGLALVGDGSGSAGSAAGVGGATATPIEVGSAAGSAVAAGAGSGTPAAGSDAMLVAAGSDDGSDVGDDGGSDGDAPDPAQGSGTGTTVQRPHHRDRDRGHGRDPKDHAHAPQIAVPVPPDHTAATGSDSAADPVVVTKPVTPPIPPVVPKPITPVGPTRTPVVAASMVSKVSGDVPPLKVGGSAQVSGDVLAKMCIDERGAVTEVSIKKAAPEIAGVLQSALRGWRYKPYKNAAGALSPVCFPLSLHIVIKKAD